MRRYLLQRHDEGLLLFADLARQERRRDGGAEVLGLALSPVLAQPLHQTQCERDHTREQDDGRDKDQRPGSRSAARGRRAPVLDDPDERRDQAIEAVGFQTPEDRVHLIQRKIGCVRS
ncbi:hypothetical protein EON77_09760 [bacterium]|nr:MAG: hypothetical protein EON77_09760 [bacterium]